MNTVKGKRFELEVFEYIREDVSRFGLPLAVAGYF
jgi:hypothetical protein